MKKDGSLGYILKEDKKLLKKYNIKGDKNLVVTVIQPPS